MIVGSPASSGGSRAASAANAGKGAAVRAGMLAAKGAYRVFADADGATPIEEIKRLSRCSSPAPTS